MNPYLQLVSKEFPLEKTKSRPTSSLLLLVKKKFTCSLKQPNNGNGSSKP